MRVCSVSTCTQTNIGRLASPSLQLFNSQPDLRAYQQMDTIEGEYAAPPTKLSLWWYDNDGNPGPTDVKIRTPGGETRRWIACLCFDRNGT
jgi:hypothetical protein